MLSQAKQATYWLFWVVITPFFPFLTSSSNDRAKVFKGVTAKPVNWR